MMSDYQKRYEEQARMQDGGQALVEADPHWAPCTICGDNVEAAYIFEDVCVCLDHTLADIIGARIKVRLYR